MKACVYIRVLKARPFKEGGGNYTDSCFSISETIGEAWYHLIDRHESYVTYKQRGYCLLYKERQRRSQRLIPPGYSRSRPKAGEIQLLVEDFFTKYLLGPDD